jgi:hypothetical protein
MRKALSLSIPTNFKARFHHDISMLMPVYIAMFAAAMYKPIAIKKTL